MDAGEDPVITQDHIDSATVHFRALEEEDCGEEGHAEAVAGLVATFAGAGFQAGRLAKSTSAETAILRILHADFVTAAVATDVLRLTVRRQAGPRPMCWLTAASGPRLRSATSHLSLRSLLPRLPRAPAAWSSW